MTSILNKSIVREGHCGSRVCRCAVSVIKALCCNAISRNTASTCYSGELWCRQIPARLRFLMAVMEISLAGNEANFLVIGDGINFLCWAGASPAYRAVAEDTCPKPNT